MSHCSAVLYACFGGEVGPGQQRAQQGLGLTIQPLWDGAGAEAGESCTKVLDIVGEKEVKENVSRTDSTEDNKTPALCSKQRI